MTSLRTINTLAGENTYFLTKDQALLPGIQEKLFTLPGHYTVYLGHVMDTTIGQKKLHPLF